MTDINQTTWSETDNSNNAAPPGGWPAGMFPNEVEPSARANMGAIKRWYNRANHTLTAGGSANVLTLTYSVAPTAYVDGDRFAFIVGTTNTAAVTLNVNSLGAKAILRPQGTPLAYGDLPAGTQVEVSYNAAADKFVLMYAPLAYPRGTVVMTRRSDSVSNLTTLATWVVHKPDGSILDTTGTTTQGLEEGLNYAVDNGYGFICDGGGIKAASSYGAFDGQNPTAIYCTTTVNVHPVEKVNIIIRAVSIVSTAAVGIQFDSILDSYIELFTGGQIVASGAGACGVKFKPQNAVPSDSAFGVGVGINRIFIGPTGMTGGGSPICVQFDRSGGPFSSNDWIISEPNGGVVGLQVTDGAHAFTDNWVRFINIHAQTATCLQIGQTNDGNTALINGNRWKGDINPANGGVAIDTWGAYDKFDVSLDAGGATGATGIKLEATATGNIFDVPKILSFTTRVQDVSTAKDNIVRGHSRYVDVDLNGSGIAAIGDSTWTKIAFVAVNNDTGAAYSDWSAPLSRWFPGPGVSMISAQASWDTTVSGAVLRIAIYKNGSIIRGGESITIANTTAGGQSASISKLVHAEAETDYFEIWVNQASGAPQDLSGGINDTWATFAKLPA